MKAKLLKISVITTMVMFLFAGTILGGSRQRPAS